MRWLTALGMTLGAAAMSSPASHRSPSRPRRPHIVYVLVDDLGWNDVTLHGSTQIPTPNIERLGSEGLIFTRFYVAPVCSPTRSSLNSGRHIVNTGIVTPFPVGSTSSLNTTCNNGPLPDGSMPPPCPLLPAVLKVMNYSTHMIGKWHLGLSDWDVTPLERGFDTYFGYLNGAERYFDHSTDRDADGGDNPLYYGWDFWDGSRLADPAKYNGSYSTTVFADEAVSRISAHAQSGTDNPMYLYLAFQAVHEPLMAPQSAIDRFNKSISDPRRRVFAAMASEMDTAVGRVVSALEDANMMDDTIFILTTDNGGPACDEDGASYDSNCASNMPLRGRKFTITEGGVRGVGLVRSPFLARSLQQSKTDKLFHVTDWYFTLTSAAMQGINGSASGSPASKAAAGLLYGGQQPAFEEADGRDQWAWLSTGDDSKHNRTWMLHTIGPEPDSYGREQGSITNGTMKLVTGDYMWLSGPRAWIHTPGLNFTGQGAPGFTVHCEAPPAVDACDPKAKPCLFDLSTDPCEHHDVADQHPQLVAQLRAHLDKLGSIKKPDLANLPKIPDSCAPANNEGKWTVCSGTPPPARVAE